MVPATIHGLILAIVIKQSTGKLVDTMPTPDLVFGKMEAMVCMVADGEAKG
jgi:hypothetical protein